MDACGRVRALCEDSAYDLAVNVGQAMIASAVTERQLFVVDSQLVKNRRMDVVNVDGVAGHAVSKVVALAVGETPLESTARHEDGVRIHVMIASAAW